MIQTDDQKWIKVTNNGGWDTHTVRVYSYSRLIQLVVLGSPFNLD